MNTPFRLILTFRGLSFSFFVYGLNLLVKVWFVLLGKSQGGSWTFTVIFLNVSRGSTLFVSLYISFAQAAHDE